MIWVRQEDAWGCGPATVAMLTGRTYADVRAEIDASDGHGHNGDWSARGITHITVDRLLVEHGYFMQMRFKGWSCRRVDNVDDPAAPVRWELREGERWPPEPFAPVHYANVVQPSGNSHFVAMDAEGWVLDPMREGRYRLTDWPDVSNVTGLVAPALEDE